MTSPISRVCGDALTIRWRVSSSQRALMVAPFAILPLGLAALIGVGSAGRIAVVAILVALGLLAGYFALVLALNQKTLRATAERIEIRERPLPTGPRLSIPAAGVAGFAVETHDDAEDRRIHSVTARYQDGSERTVLITHALELAQHVATSLSRTLATAPPGTGG